MGLHMWKGSKTYMFQHKYDMYKNRRLIMISVISIVFVISMFFFRQIYNDNSTSDIENLSAATEDGSIYLAWTIPKISKQSLIELSIVSKEGTSVINLAPSATSYEYLDGVHGTMYTFIMKVKDENGNYSQGQEKKAMFLNWSRLPGLPVVSINTVNGEEPSCSPAEKPEECWGVGITDNEYVKGQLTIEENGTVTVSTGMEFRIRGNSPNKSKKPYKMQLDKPIDLLRRGNELYQDTDWVLLAGGTDFTTVTGWYVAELCQMEWQPAYKFVNVIINGDWKGCYLLMESVKKGTGRCNISSSGFILENDAYWWNSDGEYFKTGKQHEKMGYTFKYPDFTDDMAARVKKYLEEFETALYDGDSSYADYIDIDSFAGWLLAQDILGSKDGGGTNMYLYKYDFDTDNPTSTKIKMGPVWDLESSYMAKDAWASVHGGNILYFKHLLEFDDFKEAYINKWESISGTLTQDVVEYAHALADMDGGALQDSWELDAKRWGYSMAGTDEQIARLEDWFSSRTTWMESAVPEM